MIEIIMPPEPPRNMPEPTSDEERALFDRIEVAFMESRLAGPIIFIHHGPHSEN